MTKSPHLHWKRLTTGEMPWYVSTLMLSQPLHFGDYGGLGLKLVWLVLWWKKRKQSAEQRLKSMEQVCA